jgi:undecaprenyl-diphosphatase
MTVIQAIILAIIEGITEFLPVSSTGHMIIGSSLMGIEKLPFTKLFTIAIQLGAILSVVIIYWKKFIPTANERTFAFYKKLLIAFIPAVIAGLLFKKQIDKLLENVIVVAVALLVGGIVFLLLDKWFRKTEIAGEDKLPSDTKAFKIGIFQVLAMIPGVSRSAATIIGGLAQGLNKKAAAEFSFFLAVPTMFAATVKDLFDFYKDGGVLQHNEIFLLVIGNFIAFVVAILAIRSFVAYLTKYGFRVFGYYRILAGLVILILYGMGFNFSML